MMPDNPKTRARLLQAENERLAKKADKVRDFELAKFHYQVRNAEGKDFARMVQPVKPHGYTATTAARKALLGELRDTIKPANNNQFAAALKEQKHQKHLIKLWTKKQIENDITLLNFIKRYRV
ncbi:MAG: hypothetical protein P8M25_08215 [Paracoccaceae bacterium]|nr:hypothetical protein [Paracoccaceae bacterium]